MLESRRLRTYPKLEALFNIPLGGFKLPEAGPCLAWLGSDECGWRCWGFEVLTGLLCGLFFIYPHSLIFSL
jgi:hypothetical protein